MAKANRNALTAERARKLLHYDPNPGILTWKERTPDMFKDGKPGKYGKYGAERNCKIWNTKYAGKPIKCKRYDGYIVFRLDGFTYRAHRVIWLIQTGEWPAKDIDHKNVEEGNNVWSNLRAATLFSKISQIHLYIRIIQADTKVFLTTKIAESILLTLRRMAENFIWDALTIPF